ncbi:hypothetical protein [Paraburkholderia sp.]|uniref:hypothetical protein n=1 Tax=Paraburkholderia sp. TaxID=1926495 RepID=UPI0039E55943
MEVTATHHIDSSEPDENGMYDYYYEYDIYEFTDGNISYIARSYIDEPLDAHFLKMKADGEHEWRIMGDRDRDTPLFTDAVTYLRGKGKINIQCLFEGGYKDI